MPLTTGRVLALEPLQPGERIAPTKITLRAGSAVTAYVVAGFP